MVGRRWTTRAAVLIAALAFSLGSSTAFADKGGAARADNSGPDDLDTAPFPVSVDIALASLISLGDAHLQRMAASMRVLAQTSEARSGDWARIAPLLAEVAENNVAALNWFALPDGSYWSVQQGREAGNLSDRAYFPRALEGDPAIGDLVVSKATGKAVAIVAVPIVQEEDTVGVLGASIYLDELSARIREEMGLGDHLIFYAFDDQPVVGLAWDPDLVFLEPRETDDEEVINAFRHMLSRNQGEISYRFRGQERTVIFRRSPVTDWLYAFGRVSGDQEARKPSAPD